MFAGVPFEDLLDNNDFLEEVRKKGVFMSIMEIKDLSEAWHYDLELGIWVMPIQQRE